MYHVFNLQFYSDDVTTHSIYMDFSFCIIFCFCWKFTVPHDFTRDVLMSHTLSQDSHMRFTRDVKVFIPHLWMKDNVYSWWQSRCGDSWPAARQDIFKKWKISVTAEFCHKHKMYKQLKNQSDKHSHCLSTMEVKKIWQQSPHSVFP